MKLSEVDINYGISDKPGDMFRIGNIYGAKNLKVPHARLHGKKNPRLGIPESSQAVTESSGYSLAGSFTHDLTTSKVWLMQELAKIAPRVGTVYVLGSWFGNLSLYMNLMPMIKFDKIINVETNDKMLKQSGRMLDHIRARDVQHMFVDANDLDYRQLGQDGVVINTSLTDMDGRAWYENIPPSTLVALQARDHDPGNKFNGVEDIVKKFPLDVIYQGALDLEDPETKYTRFMVIGTKPNTP